MNQLYDYGGGQGDDQMDGEPLTREESIWVWSILITFTIAPVFMIWFIARHLDQIVAGILAMRDLLR